MQGFDMIQMAIIGGPGIIVGLIIGYILGGIKSLGMIERGGLGIVIGVVSGVIVMLLLVSLLPAYVTATIDGAILSILAFTIGIAFGAVINWEASAPIGPKRRMTFDPDEDDAEFDRQLEETLGTSKFDIDD
ncbi:MAG: hypothetical protein RTU30_01015 [Candidatus Thorarchaeota archaeon]